MSNNTQMDTDQNAMQENTMAIVNGILNGVDSAIEQTKLEAENYVKASKEKTVSQVANILKDAEDKAKRQASVIIAEANSKVILEERKTVFIAQETMAAKIIDKVVKKLAQSISKPEYKSYLREWIVEAAIGLSADDAVVNASVSELKLIDDSLLRDAEKSIFAASGKETKLSIKKNDPLTRQGIYLVSQDGQTAYDNTIKARLARSSTEIKKMIYETFFKGKVNGEIHD